MKYSLILLFSLVVFAFGLSVVLAGNVLFEIPRVEGTIDGIWGHSDDQFGLNIAEFIFSHGAGYPGVCEIGLWVAQSGNPTDDVTLSLYRDGIYTSDPTSQPLFAHSVIHGSSLPTSTGQKTVFKLDKCFDSVGLSDMWFVLSRTSPDSQGGYISQIVPFNMADNWGFSSFVPGRGWFLEQSKEMRLDFESATSQTKTPVLIIPGIAGTELYDNNDRIWMNLQRMFFDVGDQFLVQSLALNNDGTSQRVINTGDIIKLIEVPQDFLLRFREDIFSGLISSLSVNNYVPESSLFVLPYDWRLNIDDNIAVLKNKIEAIKGISGFDKIDIVAHSMGGLLLEDYVKQYGNSSIDKLIFVGTPHLGAPKAAKTILAGDSLGIWWLEKNTIKDLAKNMVSMDELLPRQSYFNQSGSGYIRPFNAFFPEPYMTYSETKDFLLSQGSSGPVFTKAEDFFSKNLESISFGSAQVYNIAGCKTETQAYYRLKADNTIGKVGYITGDSTVPLLSADYVSTPNKFYVKNGIHSELPSTSGVRDLITNILTGQPLGQYSNIKIDTAFCNFKGKQLVWKSPVDVHIYDQNNNHSGPIANNGLENNIPGVDYEIISGEKFIFLPTDDGQQYRIEGNATDTSTFDLVITSNDNGQETQSTVFNDVAIIPNSQVKFNVSGTSTDSQINLDYSNSGILSVMNASSVLNSSQIDDITPPVTIASVSGTQDLNGWYKSSVTVTLNASDDNSGILEIKYSINGGPFISYALPIPVVSEGISTVRYYSVDKAGNDEEIKTLEVKIDTIAPEFQIKFDTIQKALLVTSSDSISCTSVACTANDLAGNNSVLKFSKLVIGSVYTLSLKSVTYNGQPKDLSSNVFLVNFSMKNGQINTFDQVWLVKNQEIVGIHYDKTTNKSTIITYKNGALNKEVVVGIRFLQISIERGIIVVKI